MGGAEDNCRINHSHFVEGSNTKCNIKTNGSPVQMFLFAMTSSAKPRHSALRLTDEIQLKYEIW